MTESHTVLCVISDEQYQEYEDDFASLRGANADITLESSPELALSMVEALNPSLVIVGMEIEDMEGIEFIALLMNRCKDFNRPLVILPDKDDGLPPIIHSRGAGSRSSTVDAVDFDVIAELLAQPVPEVAKPAEPVVPQPEIVPPSAENLVPEIEAALESDTSKHVHAGSRETAGAGKSRLGVVIAAAVVVVVGLTVVGYLLFFGDSAVEPTTADSPDGTVGQPGPDPVAGETQAAAGAGGGAEPTAVDTGADEAAGERPASAEATREIVLPISFKRGKSSPTITDEGQLDSIVETLGESESKIEIAGYTSAEGGAVDNLQLGIQRARAAMKELVRRGVAAERFEIVSRGERAPMASNETKEGRRRNRRVAITFQSGE
jgi:outer membrane protein OmpA-like peptidoglycan-associated protein